MTLDVAISTYRPEGIHRVGKMLEGLPVNPEVKYIVSWQEHQEVGIPEALKERWDVEVYRLDVKGLSNNRNNALEHCKGDIVLIADDDLEYYPDFAEKIIKTFKKNESIDLATFKIDYSSKKSYPKDDQVLNLPFPKGYYVNSIEIAFRRESIKDLRFWPGLGLGSPSMGCGEEELFLVSSIKRHLNCRFINSTIGKHVAPTTGTTLGDSVLRGQGFVTQLIYPYTSFMRHLVKAFRIKKGGKGNFFRSVVQLSRGSLNAITSFKKIPSNMRW